MKTVFVHTDRCIGCRQCEFGCAVEHSRSRDPVLALWEDPLPHTRIHVEAGPRFNLSFPNKCRHCNPAPCVQACPTAALHRDDELDLVLLDSAKCIACAMCAMVCPFDAVTFHPAANGGPVRVVATKCDGCFERVRHGRVPACVEACKVGALEYGDVNDLVKAGRIRGTAAALATDKVTARAAPDGGPAAVEGWRAWGEATATVTGVISQ